MADFYTSTAFFLEVKSAKAFLEYVNNIERLDDIDLDDIKFTVKNFSAVPHCDDVVYFGSSDVDIYTLATILQSAVKEEPEGTIWEFTSADTCSDLRADAFVGNAVIITADTVEYISLPDTDDIRNVKRRMAEIVPAAEEAFNLDDKTVWVKATDIIDIFDELASATLNPQIKQAYLDMVDSIYRRADKKICNNTK